MKNLDQFSNRLLGNLDELLTQTFRTVDPSPVGRQAGVYRSESEEAYRLRLDVPGFTKDEVAITTEKQELLIHAKTEREDAFRDEFRRTYQLPDEIDTTNITAKLENGVLDLSLPKIKESAEQTHKIEIS